MRAVWRDISITGRRRLVTTEGYFRPCSQSQSHISTIWDLTTSSKMTAHRTRVITDDFQKVAVERMDRPANSPAPNSFSINKWLYSPINIFAMLMANDGILLGKKSPITLLSNWTSSSPGYQGFYHQTRSDNIFSKRMCSLHRKLPKLLEGNTLMKTNTHPNTQCNENKWNIKSTHVSF